jgi:hypothetical protein
MRWIILLGLLVLSGCVSNSAPPAEPRDTLRLSEGGGVWVQVNLMPPVNSRTLVFEVSLDTHTVPLEGYNLEEIATFRNSEGAVIREGFTWKPEGESSHHRRGFLYLESATPLITSKTKYIVLEFEAIAGVKRSFRWEV